MTRKVTCPDTLCPSTAHTVLTREADEYATRWNAVWAEATPAAVAVVDVDSDVGVGATSASAPGVPLETPHEEGGRDDRPKRHNFVVLFFGNLFLVVAMITTFALELSGAIVYLLAAGFDWTAKKLHEGGGALVLFYLISVIVVFSLLLADTMILVSGILTQEALALATFILCFLAGGPSAALEWHQTVRRSCHLFRWAFRGFHEEWACQRDMLPRAISTNTFSQPPAHKEQQQQQQSEPERRHMEVPAAIARQHMEVPAVKTPAVAPTAPLEDETIELGAENILEVRDAHQVYKD